MKKVFIVAAKRTAVGSFLGSLKNVHPADLGAALVKDVLGSTKLTGKEIDEVIFGNILSAGLGQGIARQIAIKGGIDQSVPAYSLNMICGSGMKAVLNAYTSIGAGVNHLVLAGGVESMSRAPFLLNENVRGGMKMGDVVARDHMLVDALSDAFNNVHMGITAENIAEKYQITREEQDAFALDSQLKAIKAVDAGRFDDEVVPLTVKVGREEVVFARDEYPNRTTNLEKLAKLRPAFKKDGSVTAGNSSGINDGASLLLLASEEAVAKYKLTPLAEVVSVGQAGVDPLYMGLGPVPAIKKALENGKLKLKDMDLIELNEAFASQSLGVLKELSAAHNESVESILKRTNVNGGAIALGHAVGNSGSRIIVSLIYEMAKQKAKLGLASLCIGGGMGTAIVLKRV
ncbi:MAG: Acetyl-CoA acetyltransferase [Tenericutes bacterium ADurb.Bin087]|nr:MAG: Acetyl-CoA acetyltransferase [Tenericutes bacterium ADurb.Bin087]